MEQGKIKDVQDILLVYRLFDTLHDYKLITTEDRQNYIADLNGKAHVAIDALLAS